MIKIKNEYRKILESRGIDPANCTVLHFRFKGSQNSYHFALMENKMTGYLFDSYEDGNVNIVVSKDEALIEKITELANSFG